MKNIKTIFIKEMRRIFTDRRMLLALFMPGILIFILYTVMGRIMDSQVIKTSVHDVTYNIAYSDNYGGIDDRPVLISYFDLTLHTMPDEKTNKAVYTSYNIADYNAQYDKLVNGELDVLIKFDDEFEDKIYVQTDLDKVNVTIQYNGKTAKGTRAYQLITASLSVAYTNYTINVEHGVPVTPNVSKEDSTLKQVISFIFPMITISLLYSTVMSICPEAIAGEKERGTLVSMLMTPIKRSEFVGGKVLSMMITAIASAVVSFIGLTASLPALFGSSLTINAPGIVVLFFAIVSILLFFVTIGTLVSALAMSNKEANSYLGPLTFVFLTLSIIPSIIGATSSDLYLAFIPVVNSSACMSILLKGDINVLFFVISILMNLLLAGLIVFLITRVFKKERFIIR